MGVYLGGRFLNGYIHGIGLQFGPTVMMSLFLIMGSFLALTGIILHSISTMIGQLKEELAPSKIRENHAYFHNPDLYIKSNALQEDERKGTLRIEKL